LRRLERLLVVGAIGVPALGAAAIDRHVQRAVGAKLVHTEYGDLGILRMARHLGRMRVHHAEAAAVAEEVFNLELLIRHHEHVAVEPGAIERGEARVVERLDVHAVDLGADLLAEASDFDHEPASYHRRI
jgi:hypothetical protein